MKKLAIPNARGNGKTTYSPYQIICCKGDDKGTDVFVIISEPPFWKKLSVTSFNLACFERALREYGFQQANKSTVVNTEYVTGFDREDGVTLIILQYDCLGLIKLMPKWRNDFFDRILINYAA